MILKLNRKQQKFCFTLPFLSLSLHSISFPLVVFRSTLSSVCCFYIFSVCVCALLCLYSNTASSDLYSSCVCVCSVGFFCLFVYLFFGVFGIIFYLVIWNECRSAMENSPDFFVSTSLNSRLRLVYGLKNKNRRTEEDCKWEDGNTAKENIKCKQIKLELRSFGFVIRMNIIHIHILIAVHCTKRRNKIKIDRQWQTEKTKRTMKNENVAWIRHDSVIIYKFLPTLSLSFPSSLFYSIRWKKNSTRTLTKHDDDNYTYKFSDFCLL